MYSDDVLNNQALLENNDVFANDGWSDGDEDSAVDVNDNEGVDGYDDEDDIDDLDIPYSDDE
jgi:hypothetical protein